MKQRAIQISVSVVLLLSLAIMGLTLRPGLRAARVTATTPGLSAIRDNAPADARYQQALKRGLSHDYAGSLREFRQLAAAEPGTNTGVWALYQASLAAETLHDRRQRDLLLAQMRREYPAHRLTLQTLPTTQWTRSRRPIADCGPRALLYLCEKAGCPATLPELRKRCGTGEHGTTLYMLESAARSKGLRTAAVRADAAYLRRATAAGIAWVNGDHYVVFEPATGKDRFSLFDPNQDTLRVLSAAELIKSSQGILLFVAWGQRQLPR